jgi:ornithine carbamoyltransferase
LFALSRTGGAAAVALDFTPQELRLLLRLAAELKAAKYGENERPRLVGENIALVFEKSSTRTRTAFEVAPMARVVHRSATWSRAGPRSATRSR